MHYIWIGFQNECLNSGIYFILFLMAAKNSFSYATFARIPIYFVFRRIPQIYYSVEFS